MNKRLLPSKAVQDRRAKLAAAIPVERHAAMKADGSWDMCVAPYMKNGKGGMREVMARLERFAEWNAVFADHASVVGRYRVEYIEGGGGGGDGDEGGDGARYGSAIREVLRRHGALKAGLEAENMQLRGDSRLCEDYVHKAVGDLQEIIATMKEMDWLHKHTKYAKLMQDACRNIGRDIRQNYGWLDEQEYREIYQREVDAVSRGIRASLCSIKNVSQ
jgi:hypothetical protein